MGLWLAQPKLDADETIRWQSSANRSLNRWITSGGQLMVTNRRVLFQPNRFDAVTGKKPWECSLPSVTGFDVLDRDLTVFAGGMRKRLGIQTSDGVKIFVVNDLEKKVAELREMLPRNNG
jgi:hypothetical protein